MIGDSDALSRLGGHFVYRTYTDALPELYLGRVTS